MSEKSSGRTVREIIGSFKMWDGRRAREVVAEYPDGERFHEIEIASNERYQLEFRKVNDDDR